MYIIWNSINDPLFGWFLDRQQSTTTQSVPASKRSNGWFHALCGGGGGGSSSGGNHKTRAVQWGGPLLGAAFLLPWFDLFGVGSSDGDGADRDWWIGIHFLFTLVVYDGLFTVCIYVLLMTAQPLLISALRTMCVG